MSTIGARVGAGLVNRFDASNDQRYVIATGLSVDYGMYQDRYIIDFGMTGEGSLTKNQNWFDRDVEKVFMLSVTFVGHDQDRAALRDRKIGTGENWQPVDR